MKPYPLRSYISALFFAFLLISCGVGGEGLIAGGGTGGTGIVGNGTITAFGSIVVNGTVFDTSSATVIVNGEVIGIGDELVRENLDIGRVVTVGGTVNPDDNSTVADSVIYNDSVSGPIESIRDVDATTKEMAVLGQVVIINVITQIKGTEVDTLAPNDFVEVSGLTDDTGVIRATFLEKTGAFNPGSAVDVTGTIGNLDLDLKTFDINNLTVSYVSIGADELPEGFKDGLVAEIAGTLDVTGGEMLATSIGRGDTFDDDNADRIEVFGFVTNRISVFAFTIGGQAVQLDADTLFIDGTPQDVLLGVKLEAEGSLVDGIIFANEIEFWGPDQIEVEGLVSNITSENEFTIRNQAGDQVVQTDAENTAFVGLDPAEIELGLKIEVKGVPVDFGHSILVADKVSLEVG